MVDEVSIPTIQEYASDSKIDDPANLAGAPVFLIAGEDDYVVPAELPA